MLVQNLRASVTAEKLLILIAESRVFQKPVFLARFATMLQGEPPHGFDGLGFGNRTDFLDEIRKWASRQHERYRLTAGKPRWADKSANNIEVLDELETLFGPGSRYVMIFKQPLEVLFSSFDKELAPTQRGGDSLKEIATHLVGRLNAQLSFAQKHPHRCFRLYYRDLLVNPEQTLDAVKFMEKLEIPSEAMRARRNSKERNRVPLDGCEQNPFGLPEIAPILPIIGDIASRLGYGVQSLGDAKFESGVEARFLSQAGVVAKTSMKALIQSV